MQVIELLDMLSAFTKEYRLECNDSIKRNKHQNTLDGKYEFAQEEIDAVLVDFINYIASSYCVDYALEVRDITGEET